MPPRAARRAPLTADAIVDAARTLIARDGLPGLSMRRLGDALGVDPMAVYHHVPNKQALLARVVARVVTDVTAPDPAAPWDERVRAWASSYWEVVADNRALMAAALADPVVAAGGMPAVEPLTAAVSDSGLAADRVEPTVWLVVDVVHGSALGTHDRARLRAAFRVGLDTVLAGIAAIAGSGTPRPAPRGSR